MNKILFALVLISSPALAQWDRQYFEYRDGSYSEIPFRYPSILKAEEVREIVGKIEELTGDKIVRIGYLPIPGLPESNNEIQISVCSKGTRPAGSCDSGDLYLFQRIDDSWDRKGDQIGKWVY